jgi:hypothetical protein
MDKLLKQTLHKLPTRGTSYYITYYMSPLTIRGTFVKKTRAAAKNKDKLHPEGQIIKRNIA